MLGILALVSAVALVLVWLAYPLGVAALAAVFRTHRDRGIADLPGVSVVLATRDDAADIRARVENCLESSYDPAKLEMVVAVDARTSRATAQDLGCLDERVRVVGGDEPGGKAATLNAGVRAARGEVVVFTDTHQRFDPEAIPRLVSAVSDPRTGAASGSLELASGGGIPSPIELYWRFERWLRRNEGRLHSTVGVTGAIYAMRRSLWTPLPPGLILDDLYVPMKVVLQGYRVAFVEEAHAFETRRPGWAQEYQRKVRTLTGNIQLCAWLPSVLVPVRNPVWFQFVFHKLLRLLTPYWALAIGVWVVVAGGRWAGSHLPQAMAVLAVLLLLGLVAMPGIGRPVRTFLFQGALMQAAIITATINGLRGRWDVWPK